MAAAIRGHLALTPGLRLRASDLGLRTFGLGPRISNLGSRSADVLWQPRLTEIVRWSKIVGAANGFARTSHPHKYLNQKQFFCCCGCPMSRGIAVAKRHASTVGFEELGWHGRAFHAAN